MPVAIVQLEYVIQHQYLSVSICLWFHFFALSFLSAVPTLMGDEDDETDVSDMDEGEADAFTSKQMNKKRQVSS